MLGAFAQRAKPPWRCLQQTLPWHTRSASAFRKSRRSPENNNVNAGLVDQGVRAVLCPAVALLLACRGAARQVKVYTQGHSVNSHCNSRRSLASSPGCVCVIRRSVFYTGTPHGLFMCAPPCTPAPFTDDAVMPRMPLLLRARTTIGNRQGRMMACRARSCQGRPAHVRTAANAGCRTRRTACCRSCAAVPPCRRADGRAAAPRQRRTALSKPTPTAAQTEFPQPAVPDW